MYSYSLTLNRDLALAVVLALTMMTAPRAQAQPGGVLSHQKISDSEGGFTGSLDDYDQFGTQVASLGDLDGDGVGDLAVGTWRDDDGGNARGAVWVLFLNADGTVKSHQKISDTEGGFTGKLHDNDRFGFYAASLGDLDGDGPSVLALAVGAPHGDDGGNRRGAVWVLFLNANATVESHQKISDTQGGFTGILDNNNHFGSSVASLGDLDGDGVGDLAVGAFRDDDGGPFRGAVWILFLNTDGTVKSHQKISDTEGGFSGILDNEDSFGGQVALLGDLDGDGVRDLAVSGGALWILFLNTDGTVKSHQEIIDPVAGGSLAFLEDLDGNGVGDLAVGAGDDGGGENRGAVWVLFLNRDGTVKSHQKMSDTAGDFTGTLDDKDGFGASVASLGDLDGDGVGDLAVGAARDDDGGEDRGAVWILFLNTNGTVKTHQKISDTEGGFTGTLEDADGSAPR
ncbi:MAG: integrin alpha [Phycisphaerae bacterium]